MFNRNTKQWLSTFRIWVLLIICIITGIGRIRIIVLAIIQIIVTSKWMIMLHAYAHWFTIDFIMFEWRLSPSTVTFKRIAAFYGYWIMVAIRDVEIVIVDLRALHPHAQNNCSKNLYSLHFCGRKLIYKCRPHTQKMHVHKFNSVNIIYSAVFLFDCQSPTLPISIAQQHQQNGPVNFPLFNLLPAKLLSISIHYSRSMLI